MYDRQAKCRTRQQQNHRESARLSALPAWVRIWSIVASVLVTLDCVYVFSVEYKTFVPAFVQSLWTWYGTSDTQYSSTGQGIKESNGWMLTQSKFNVAEVCCQLLFLFCFERDSIQGLLSILFGSICTLWKTLLYMSIIYHSSDPVYMVPGLKCLGFQAVGEGHKVQVEAALKADSCPVQLFKFQFNFWWILVPAIITNLCFRRIVKAFEEKNS